MFKSRTHYINHYRRLINLEREADMSRHEEEINRLSGAQREKKGRALLNMRGRRAGRLYGEQHLIKYMKSDVGRQLPELDMNVGDVVILSQGHPLKKGNPLGTIVDKGRHSITVMFEGRPDKWMLKHGLRVDLYVNDVTYRRMQEALDVIMYGREASPRLMGWLIGEKDKYIAIDKRKQETLRTQYGNQNRSQNYRMDNPYNEQLNNSQLEAVRNAMNTDDFYIVHGPPGTGKTVTGVEILCQSKDRYTKVLATADSNGAVDNLARGLVKQGIKAVRIGQSFKVHPEVRGISLDVLMAEHQDYKQIEHLREKAFQRMKDQEGLKHPSPRWTRGLRNNEIHRLAKRGKGSRGVSASDMKEMSKWLTIREDVDKYFAKADAIETEVIQSILREAEVILSTNSGAGQALLEGWEFDLVLIDESTQSTESSAMIPAVKGKRLIMLGDHKQLPPTVISMEAEEKGFGISLLERLIERYGQAVVSMLMTQYRMNEKIMAYPNEWFYDGKLVAGEENKSWVTGLKSANTLLKQCLELEESFIHICGLEKRLADSPSVMNTVEAELVCQLTRALIEAGAQSHQVGIISPYKAQAKMIRDMLSSENIDIQVDTVDGFQGQEKDIVIISMVRSNKDRHIGFLNDIRRLNVALTRARKLRIVVGDKNTIQTHNVYRAFLDRTNVIEI